MTRILREHLALVGAVAFLGLFFVFNGGEHFMLSRLVMIAWLVLAVLAWKPLHKRFRAWAILFSYFQVSLPLILLSDPSASLSGLLRGLFLVFAISAIVLLFNRQKPIEQRRPDLAFMILNGHWELLAKNGVPADEIERMKRLTQEERGALMASLKVRHGKTTGARDRHDELLYDPIYSELPGNANYYSARNHGD